MAVAKRPEGRQEELVVATSETRRLNQPFYQALERMLKTEGFAAFAEQAYCEFYAEKMTCAVLITDRGWGANRKICASFPDAGQKLRRVVRSFAGLHCVFGQQAG